MAKPDKPASRVEHRVRVVTDLNRRVHAAGAWWAGISEVRADTISAAQLVELRANPLLEVTEVDVEVDLSAEILNIN